MSFIDSESDFSDSYYEDEFSGFKEEESESISEEASESDCDLNIFPITAQRRKRVVRFADFEYYE